MTVVVTKIGSAETIGFVKTRKRKLKGGWIEKIKKYDFVNDCLLRDQDGRQLYFPLEDNREPTTAASFDLMKGYRNADGKPRNRFVLTLGSLRADADGSQTVLFWLRAFLRLAKHGLDAEQRQRIAADMVRKGARLPTVTDIRGMPTEWAELKEADELLSLLQGQHFDREN